MVRMIMGGALKENKRRLLWGAMLAFILLMLASLVFGIFNPLFFGSDGGRVVQGIDFFSIPKAFINLLEGRSMYDSWGGTPYGPYSTYYSYHPAFPVFFSSYLSFFSPWVSYWIFTFLAISIMGYCGYLVSRLTSNIFEKQMCFIFFFCSFVTYWLLYVGNMHSIAVLSSTLIIVGMYELAYSKDEWNSAASNNKIMTGLLISLFSKPISVLILPVLLINKETRITALRCVGIYAVVSLAFLFVPILNPESIGLEKIIETAMDPAFIREHLNIYTNNFVLNEYMKDNSIHWFYIIAQSEFYWNHIDIFSLSAFLNSAMGTMLPGFFYKIPLLFILLCSAGIFFVKDRKEQLEISLLIIIATGFSYFLSYNTVWEYQYTSLFPSVAVLFLMYRSGKLKKPIALLLILCLFYYLPSPYFLVRENSSIANMNWIRSTKVIPSLICFVVLSVILIRKLKSRIISYLENKLILPGNRLETSGTMNKFLFGGLSVFFLLVLLLVYSNHFHNAFHFDDSHTVVNNLYIQNIKNIPLFFTDGTTFSSLPSNQSYRPVVTSALAIDYWLGGGLNPFYFHLSTFVFFVLQGVLMFFLFRKIFYFASPSAICHLPSVISYLSLFAVAWYLLHPANAETINYVIARSDSLSTFFVLLALIMYMYSTVCRKYYLYLLPVAVGALAKISAVMFAPLLLVYVILYEKNLSVAEIFGGRNLRTVFSVVWRLMPVFLFSAILYVFVQRMESDTWTAGGTSRYLYFITQPYVILHYFKTFFFPLWLSADTDWTTFDSLLNLKAMVGFVFIALLFLLAAATSKHPKFRPISFGIFWFFIALVPSSSFVALSEVMNDHRIFFPYVGLVAAAVWTMYLIFSLLKRAFIYSTLFICLLFLSAYAYGTYQRNKVWRTDESLWLDVTVKSPKNARGLMNYGLVLMGKADYHGAEKQFTDALKLWPYYAYLHVNMGVLKSATGYPQNAERYFKNAIAYRGDVPDCYYYYAEFLYKQKRVDEAIQMLNKTLELSQAHTSARCLLMAIYLDHAEFDKLRQLAEETLKILPSDAQALYYLQAVKWKKSK